MRKRPDKTEITKRDLRVAFWHIYSNRVDSAGSKNPIDTITIQQLVDEAGYNRATFYLHYQNIYELFDEIKSEMLIEMTQCVEGCMKSLSSDSSKLNLIVELGKVVAFYEKRKHEILVLLGKGGDPSFIISLKEELKPIWFNYVATEADLDGRNQGEIELLIEYTLSGTLFMISKWLKDPNDVSAAQMGHLVYDMAIRDIAARIED